MGISLRCKGCGVRCVVSFFFGWGFKKFVAEWVWLGKEKGGACLFFKRENAMVGSVNK